MSSYLILIETMRLVPFLSYYHLFPKILKRHVTVTTPTQGTVCNPNANVVNQRTKFEVSSFSHSGDILGGGKTLNGSLDHNSAPFDVIFYLFGKT